MDDYLFGSHLTTRNGFFLFFHSCACFLYGWEIGHFENLNDQFLEPQWVFILVAERIISVAEALEATLFQQPQYPFISVAEALEATCWSEHHARFLSISMNFFSFYLTPGLHLKLQPNWTKLKLGDRGICVIEILWAAGTKY